MVGHIKLDRKILNWEWYQDANVFRVFIHLLLAANHKDGRWKGIEVLRGQVIVGTPKLASILKLGRQEIRTTLNKLKLTNEITIEVTNKYSIVTICKYDTYQSFKTEPNQQNNQHSTNNQPTTNQQLTTNNNDNNDNNDKEDKKGAISIFENPKLWESEKQSFLNAGNWIFKFCTDKQITVDVFDEKAKEFISDIELKEDFKPVKELRSHFTNWYNLKIKLNGNSNGKKNGTDYKSAGADLYAERIKSKLSKIQ